MKNPFKMLDNFFIKLINQKMNNAYTNFLFYHITNLGGAVSVISITLLLFIIGGKPRELSLEIILSLIVSTLLVQILKRIFSRNRPYWILENLNTYGIDLSDYSFPSGHSAAAFTLGMTIALNYPAIKIVVLIVATLIAISRIYLGVHYPTDVLAGVIIGIIASVIVHEHIYQVAITYLRGKFI
ncbi:undecaprenyl-diphosphatase [Peptoniphilus asaccharolyticus DSM 20463]|uniref:Undecaprenyl-diphosphatase n=1 Tax=Peptoniphilus asaccharolyticus DSM 20463 TaxID=573058 RepID=A0A1W1UYQ8_PEPAS|nr:phosphatase PAP2 family protein [Peptoniphilus asaccharolyticus]MBL7575355.1 phosphatase PAP2 family protein [Peptoniphilus asaccharolyticus]SMB86140.1 undecaprenyl-diphosphatase [Peptoniphilus asaccharolyticus DSM 20463]